MNTTLYLGKTFAVLATCIWLAGCILPPDRGGYGDGRYQDRHGDDSRGDPNRGNQDHGDWDRGHANRGNGYGN